MLSRIGELLGLVTVDEPVGCEQPTKPNAISDNGRHTNITEKTLGFLTITPFNNQISEKLKNPTAYQMIILKT